MLCSGLPKLLKFLKTAIDDMLVTRFGQRDPSTEPLFFLQLKHVLQVVRASTFIRKAEFYLGGCDVACLESLDVALQGSAAERIAEHELAIDFLPVAAEWRCCHVDDFGLWKTLNHLLPTLRGAVVSFVHDNHVEEIGGKLRQPLIDVRSELLNVGDDNVRLSGD